MRRMTSAFHTSTRCNICKFSFKITYDHVRIFSILIWSQFSSSESCCRCLLRWYKLLRKIWQLVLAIGGARGRMLSATRAHYFSDTSRCAQCAPTRSVHPPPGKFSVAVDASQANIFQFRCPSDRVGKPAPSSNYRLAPADRTWAIGGSSQNLTELRARSGRATVH